MIKKYLLIAVSLLISLFIYLFYRTGKTVVNELFVRLISVPTYTNIKAAMVHTLPLNDVVIYSLPEGLWIFSITLTSKCYYIVLNRRRFDCVYIPLIFCLSLEVMQLIHVTNGRFDLMDIGVSFLFWLLARYSSINGAEKNHLLTQVNLKTLVCLMSYGIVYLAHVLK